MQTVIDTMLHPIDTWRTTDNTAVWIGSYIAAALAVVCFCWGVWAFVSGLFDQATKVAGI
ncbi:MAG: hypothetical protein ACTHOC_12745 [Luteimonas sp.]